MTWAETQAAHLTGGRIETCEAGHETHAHRKVDTILGTMIAYDADRYEDQHGFCPADDIVSRQLVIQGRWEAANHVALQRFRVLDNPEPGEIVIDVGCQVGWYTTMAARAGFEVLAVDAVQESLDMAEANGGSRVTPCRAWLDQDTPGLDPVGAPPVRLVKADIEGNEEHALRVVWPLITAGLVDHLLLELSPVFNDTYPALVAQIRGEGYRAWLPHKGKAWDWALSWPQAEVLFSRS